MQQTKNKFGMSGIKSSSRGSTRWQGRVLKKLKNSLRGLLRSTRFAKRQWQKRQATNLKLKNYDWVELIQTRHGFKNHWSNWCFVKKKYRSVVIICAPSGSGKTQFIEQCKNLKAIPGLENFTPLARLKDKCVAMGHGIFRHEEKWQDFLSGITPGHSLLVHIDLDAYAKRNEEGKQLVIEVSKQTLNLVLVIVEPSIAQLKNSVQQRLEYHTGRLQKLLPRALKRPEYCQKDVEAISKSLHFAGIGLERSTGDIQCDRDPRGQLALIAALQNELGPHTEVRITAKEYVDCPRFFESID